MTTSAGPYRRLPGSGRRTSGLFSLVVPRNTLWLGRDHLLSVDSWGYSEDYRRFAYNEIQAITVRKTSGYLVGNVTWGILFLAAALSSFAAGPVWGIVLRVVGGVFLPFLLVNLALGPTCRATLHTAVTVEELPAWRRLRSFRRGMERLRPLIQAAQKSAEGAS